MAHTPLDAVMQHVRSLVGAQSGQTDGALLHAFSACADQAAFAALMKRHGPLVLAVCRRVLHQLQDAEDAFQATFIVLARQAASLSKKGALGGWLHRVSYRIALDARRAGTRRRKHERRSYTMSPTNPAFQAAWREVQLVLDEEVQRLPEKYREPFILCCLENQSCAAVARRLGLKEVTISSRLAEARKRLQKRLSRRGVELTAVLGAAALAPDPIMAGALMTKVVSAATLPTSVISERVAFLVHGMTRCLMLQKAKMGVVVFLAVSAMVGVTGVGAFQVLRAGQPAFQDKNPGMVPIVKQQDSVLAKKPALTDQYGDPLPEGAVARLGTIRLRHGASPRALVFAPDNKSLASAGMDGTVHIWRTDTGKELLRIENNRFPHAGLAAVFGLAYAPDGKTLAGARLNEPACLWDVVTGKELLQFGGDRHRASWVVFSPDGKSLAYGGSRDSSKFERTDPVVRLADVNTGKDVHQFGGHKGFVTQVTFSPDGTMLASADDEMIRVFDVATGRARNLPQPEDKPVRFTSLAFSPDGKTLAAASQMGKMIRLVEVTTGKAIHTIKLTERELVDDVLFTPDGKTLISGHFDGFVRFWQVDTGTKTREFRAHYMWVIALALSPDGRTLATSSNSADNTVRLWETATGTPLVRYPGPQQGVHHVVFAPDGKRVATSSGEGAVHAWEAATGQLLHHWQRHGSLAFMPDSETLVCGGWRDGQIYFLSLATSKETRQFPAHKVGISAICLTRDGKTLATAGGDNFIRLWDLDSGKQVQDFGGKQKGFVVAGLALSPDAKLLASIHENSILRLWETSSGKLLREDNEPSHVGSVTFSPDGKLLAYTTRMGVPGVGPMVRLRDLATGTEIRQLKESGNANYALEFSPDSRTLIWGSELWEVATGQQRRKFTWHQGYVNCLAFSPNGRLIAFGSSNASVLICDVAGGHDLQKPSAPLTTAVLENLWSDLAAPDAPAAYRAICTLRASPRQCLQLFERHLKPVPRADAKRLTVALRNLDNPQFAVRSAATKELETLGEAAKSALRQVLAEKPSLEVRQRVEKLLDRFGSVYQLRQGRAFEVLEHIGSPEAKTFLETLAHGAPEARETEEAKASLERLAARAAK